MALAICLLFDARTDRALRRLWQRAEAIGVPTLLTHTHGVHVPHLSYAVLREYEVARVLTALAALPPGEPVPLHFDAVGHFHRGRLALVASVSTDVLVRQGRVVDAVVGSGADLHHYYAPGRWLPHTSVATHVRAAQLAELTSMAHDMLPLDALADHAAVIDSGTGQRWPLAGVP